MTAFFLWIWQHYLLFNSFHSSTFSIMCSCPTDFLFSVLTTECASRKGRTKKEASCNTNRHIPAGHERKIVEKLQNAEKKSKEWHRRGTWNTLSFQINNWDESMLIEQSRLSCRLNRTAITGNRPPVSLRETGAELQRDPPQDERSGPGPRHRPAALLYETGPAERASVQRNRYACDVEWRF